MFGRDPWDDPRRTGDPRRASWGRRRDGWEGFDPYWVRPQRKLLRKTRAMFRGALWVQRKGWARRRPLAPLYLTLAVFVIAAIAHQVKDGWKTIAALAALAALVFAGYRLVKAAAAKVHKLPKQRLSSYMQWWLGGAFVSYTSWAVWAALDGVMQPRLGILWVGILPVFWVTALWRYRIRPDADVDEADDRVTIWEEAAAGPDGIAPQSTMGTPSPIDEKDPSLGWRAPIILSWRGRTTPSNVSSAVERLSLLYNEPVANIAVEPGERPRDVNLTVFTRNPLFDREWWPGPGVFDPTTGVQKISRYLTGGHALYRFWGDIGPVHDSVSGVTGSGKSAFLNALLAVERDSPLMASVVIDPQGGQSLPRWTDSVAIYGRSAAEGREILLALVDEMFRRNELLANVEWVDAKGRPMKGVDSFHPDMPVIRQLGLPLICVTVEEAGMQLKDPMSLNALITLSTMARKCGIKLRLVLQTPLLDQFKSNVLREQLFAGNVVVFRTAAPVSGQIALAGVLPASPHLLPRDMPGAMYVIGPELRSVMSRTWPIEDVHHWATVGETTQLPELQAALRRARVQAKAVDAEVVDTPQAQPQAGVGAKPNESAIARIERYINSRRWLVTTGTIADDLGVGLSTVSQSCRRLADRGKIVDHKHSLWGAIDTSDEAAA